VDIKRRICHEAGHAVAALHFGLRVERVEVFRGMPRTLIDLKCGTRESMIVLASGIAAEQFIFSNYDSEACGSDQKTISEYGGGAIQDLLHEAMPVIRSHEACLGQMRAQLTKRWVGCQAECEAASNFDADSNSLTFELLSHHEIYHQCSEFGQGARSK